MKLPFITKEIPPVGAKFEKTPESFIVEEVPLFEPSESGNHLYIYTKRKSMSTVSLRDEMARVLGIKAVDIGYAGLKDRDSTASQLFSVPRSSENTITFLEKELGVEILWAKPHEKKLRIGKLLGNRFKIRLTQISQKDLPNLRLVLSRVSQLGLPNFYGEQRFGAGFENHLIGREVIIGTKKIKDPWKRKFLISSYQSFLFNLYLSERIERRYFSRLLVGDIMKKHGTGGVFRLDEASESAVERFRNFEISPTGPIFGYKMDMPSKDALSLEQKVLESESMSLENFERLKAKGTRRFVRVPIKEVSISEINDGVEIQFFLTTGSYATVLISEILKSNYEFVTPS